MNRCPDPAEGNGQQAEACGRQAAVPPPAASLTAAYLRQVREAFRQRCLVQQPPTIQELFYEMGQLARTICQRLTAQQALLLLQEHPAWISEALTRREESVAAMVAEHLGYLRRWEINDHWLTILHKEETPV